MLIGLFVRHYKTYRNINFIPISNGTSFTAFLGSNGVGKSSILDALDKFFNGGDWSINLQAKSDGGISSDDKVPFIVPVFLIEKPLLKSDVVELISKYFWNTNYKTVDALSDFYKIRSELLEQGYSENSHYLIAIGRQHQRNGAFLGSFSRDPDMLQLIEKEVLTDLHLADLLQKIVSIYAYFYIPVEADAGVYSALESMHVQKLLDEDIKGKIESAIGHKNVGEINNSLNEFISEISNSLKSYEYKGSYKNKLTMNDLVEKVFESYFSIKILHGKREGYSIAVRDMSAGEKRRALIDLAYSLLARSKARSHTVILAVDEPDASLHTAACHDQFTKLAEITGLTLPETQVLVTTHWYGFLPIIQRGSAHAIRNASGKIEFDSFDLYNYREQIRQKIKSSPSSLALDVELKSYNDMIQSIVSSVIRKEAYNWILCEGLSDKIYLEYYLSDLIAEKNLRIVPLGGLKEVRRAYEYLIKPLNDSAYSPEGKVLCLVDTDAQFPVIDVNKEVKCMYFKRLVYDNKSNDCLLVEVDNELRSPATEIEHSLEPMQFLLTVEAVDVEEDGEVIREIVRKTTYNNDGKVVYSYLDMAPSLDRRMMEEYFDINDNKVRFAYQYTSTPILIDAPEWIKSIRKIFSENLVKSKK